MNMSDGGNYNVTTNLSVWEYLERARGPQQLDWEISIPLTVLNVVIFVTGLLGNTAVCVVIIRHPSMQTATNYYLFNLAVSDLTLLIFGTYAIFIKLIRVVNQH